MIHIQRHIGAAGLHHGQQGQRNIHAARQGHANPCLGADTRRDQSLGQAVGARIQFSEAQAALLILQRDSLRLGGSLGCDNRRQRLESLSTGRYCTAPQRFVEPGTRLQRRIRRLLRQCTQQREELLGHALHTGSAIALGSVAEAQLEAGLALSYAQHQVEGGFQIDLTQAFHVQPLQCHRSPYLMVERHLAEWMATVTAIWLQRLHQLLERQILMSLGIQQPIAHLAQQRTQARVGRKVAAQHQQIDEEAHQTFAGELFTPSLGKTDAQILLAGKALQQQVERRQQQHGQGHTMLLGQLTQLPAQDIVETLLDEAGTTSTLASRVDQGVWQLKRRMFLPKVSAPPLQQSCARSTVQYLLLSGGDVDVLMAQLR